MKTQIVEALGESALVLPGLVAKALQANERAKYYMGLLQACRQWATTVGGQLPDLSAERRACGEDDETLDDVVAGTRATPDGVMFVPHAGQIIERLFDSVEQMFAPCRVTLSEIESAAYDHRLSALKGRFTITGDTVPTGFIDAVTHANRQDSDSVHLLVMDLHRELNRAQRRTSEGTLDGAPQIRPSRTCDGGHPIRHSPGDSERYRDDRCACGGYPCRGPDRVVGLHRHSSIRLRCFRDLCAQAGFEWTDRAAGGIGNVQYVTLAGTRSCDRVQQVEEVLSRVGSRLVFLIDWNRARKRWRDSSRRNAMAGLRWAADHGVGHRAFLEGGGERLTYSALERVAPPELRWGGRLDEVLASKAAPTGDWRFAGVLGLGNVLLEEDGVGGAGVSLFLERYKVPCGAGRQLSQLLPSTHPRSDAVVNCSGPDHRSERVETTRCRPLIHDHSDVQSAPFVAWSCQIAKTRNGTARRDTRLVLELARGGSVFLDAIDRMSQDVQVELFVPHRSVTSAVWHRRRKPRASGSCDRSNAFAPSSAIETGTFDEAPVLTIRKTRIGRDSQSVRTRTGARARSGGCGKSPRLIPT